MNDDARAALRELVVRYGTSLADDPRRTKALLQDRLRGEHRLAIALIETAAVEGVPGELLRLPAGGDLVEIRLGQLARQLERERGLAPEAARWAVETWAAALEPEPEPEPEPEQKPEPAPEPAREEIPVQARAEGKEGREATGELRDAVLVDLVRRLRTRRGKRVLALSAGGLVLLGGAIALIAFLTGGGKGENGVEQLRQHLPTGLHACETINPGDRVIVASMRCFTAKNTLVEYRLFRDEAKMSTWFGRQIGVRNTDSETCPPPADTVVLSYSVGGVERGRVACAAGDPEGGSDVYWTDRRFNIAGDSFSDHETGPEAFDQVAEWACCLGPVARPTEAPEKKTLGAPQ